MGNRFGRKQKRKLREQLTAAESDLRTTEGALRAARHNESRAQQQAFERFVKEHGLYKMAVAVCAEAVGKQLGGELAGHQEKILGTIIREPMVIDCFSSFQPGEFREMKVVRVLLPLRPIEFNKMVG